MTKTAKVQSIYPTKEELITYEREDDLARKSLKAKAENKNYKLKKAELYNQVNDNLSETAFYRERLISALTLPEFLETSVKNVKENTQNDLFAVLSAENE
ncbi:hypothetical protein IJU97_06710 [bacterium]|nr:hypothetical protein [bacterium]